MNHLLSYDELKQLARDNFHVFDPKSEEMIEFRKLIDEDTDAVYRQLGNDPLELHIGTIYTNGSAYFGFGKLDAYEHGYKAFINLAPSKTVFELVEFVNVLSDQYWNQLWYVNNVEQAFRYAKPYIQQWAKATTTFNYMISKVDDEKIKDPQDQVFTEYNDKISLIIPKLKNMLHRVPYDGDSIRTQL